MAKTAANNAPSLVFFKLAGAVMPHDLLMSKIQACPLSLVLEQKLEPQFLDNNPHVMLKVTSTLSLEAHIHVTNTDDLLNGANRKGSFAVNRATGQTVVGYTQGVAQQAEEETDKKRRHKGKKDTAEEANIPDMLVFVASAEIGAGEETDVLEQSTAFAALVRDHEELGASVWDDVLKRDFAKVLAKYGQATSFILEAGSSVIAGTVEPPAEGEEAPPPLLPSVSREAVDQQRAKRQGRMEKIRNLFNKFHTIRYELPVLELNKDTVASRMINGVVAEWPETRGGLDSFIATKAQELIDSAIVKL